jgi:hypothetical protein
MPIRHVIPINKRRSRRRGLTSVTIIQRLRTQSFIRAQDRPWELKKRTRHTFVSALRCTRPHSLQWLSELDHSSFGESILQSSSLFLTIRRSESERSPSPAPPSS